MSWADFNIAGQMLALDSLSCHWHSYEERLNSGLGSVHVGSKISRDIDRPEGRPYVHEPVLYII